jgi:hypothetical protein
MSRFARRYTTHGMPPDALRVIVRRLTANGSWAATSWLSSVHGETAQGEPPATSSHSVVRVNFPTGPADRCSLAHCGRRGCRGRSARRPGPIGGSVFSCRGRQQCGPRQNRPICSNETCNLGQRPSVAGPALAREHNFRQLVWICRNRRALHCDHGHFRRPFSERIPRRIHGVGMGRSRWVGRQVPHSSRRQRSSPRIRRCPRGAMVGNPSGPSEGGNRRSGCCRRQGHRNHQQSKGFDLAY